jgi:hypothetical protein
MARTISFSSLQELRLISVITYFGQLFFNTTTRETISTSTAGCNGVINP